MSISTALEARRDALREREAGFTLIELLVVVIIIGILAAIAIPVYIGVQNNAKDSAVKSDLVNAKTAISAYGTDSNGAVPSGVTKAGSATVTSGTADLTKYGWSVSTNTDDLKYTVNSTGDQWCVLGTSLTTNKFTISSSGQVLSVAKTVTACTP